MKPEDFIKARKGLGLSQAQLADFFGISSRQIQNLESGKTEIKPLHESALRWVAYSQFGEELEENPH